LYVTFAFGFEMCLGLRPGNDSSVQDVVWMSPPDALLPPPPNASRASTPPSRRMPSAEKASR
jgi:hypothetical protein